MAKIKPGVPDRGGGGRRERLKKRLRVLAGQGASVVWAGRRWFVGWAGLTPADRGWGDVGWDELGVRGMAEVVERVGKERAEGARKVRESHGR